MKAIKNKIKHKIIFLGEVNSINLELIINSFNFLKNKSKYYVVGSLPKIENYLSKIRNNSNSNIKLKLISDPLNFDSLEINSLNIFDISIASSKFKELEKQIFFSNYISNLTNADLVTMPIDKSIFKKEIPFNGMTEYLGKLNQCKTMMLMKGENFSIIPITTHISIGSAFNSINLKNLNIFFNTFQYLLKKNSDLKSYKKFKFLCINPHCGEDGIINNKDLMIKKIISNLKINVDAPVAADSAFIKGYSDCLFFSTYHDQALIPFKILNKKSCNITIGLNYRRISPAHGIAKDIMFKNISDNTSYLTCMTI